MKTVLKILMILIIFFLVGCMQNRQLEDFYIEVAADKPLDDIIIKVSHTRMPDCLAYFIPSHGGGLSKDYYSVKKTSTNEKKLFKGADINLRCQSQDEHYTGNFPLRIELIHPKIIDSHHKLTLNSASSWTINNANKQFEGKPLYYLMVNTFSKNRNTCLGRINQYCSAIESFMTQINNLSIYIKNVYGEVYDTALVFEETSSVNKHIKYLGENIRENPELSDKERVYLLNEFKERFYGL